MKRRYAIAAEVLFAIAAFLSAYWFSSHLSVMFLSEDKRVYFCDQVIFEVVGKAWANGIPAYTYYFDHKGPVVFLFFCLGYLIDGTRYGVMLLHASWTAVSMYLLHKILFSMNWFKSYAANMIISSVSGIIGIMLLWTWNVQSGVVVAQITMPFILVCAWLLCHWYQNGFESKWTLHFIYGLCCMMVILARANDAIFIFLAYAMLFFTNISHKSERNLFLTILGGLLPFTWFYAYFCRYGVADTFMDCTFWSNFRYTAPSADSDEACTYAYAIALLIIFIIFTVVIYLRKQHVFLYLIGAACHLGFYVTTTRFTQYCISFLGELVVFLFIASCGLKITSSLSKKIFAMLFAVYVSFFAVFTFIAVVYTVWYRDVYDKTYEFDYMIRDEIIEHNKSYMVFNDPHLLGVMLDSDYDLPICRYALFQDWHVYCNVITKDDLKAGIDESKPDVIICVNDSPNADYYFEDYQLVDMIDPADVTDFPYRGEFIYYFYERE